MGRPALRAAVLAFGAEAFNSWNLSVTVQGVLCGSQTITFVFSNSLLLSITFSPALIDVGSARGFRSSRHYGLPFVTPNQHQLPSRMPRFQRDRFCPFGSRRILNGRLPFLKSFRLVDGICITSRARLFKIVC